MNDLIRNDTLNFWREEGSHLIPQNYQIFKDFLDKASYFLQRNKYDTAAAYCQIAAFHAQLNHCGFFVSSELENILLTIGQKAISPQTYIHKKTSPSKKARKILHVGTKFFGIGGSPKIMLRWIQEDRLNSHSIVYTQQPPNEISSVKQELGGLISSRRGKLYFVSEKPGGIVSRAKRLRECIAEAEADIVVLNLLEFDVVPTIAFADKTNLPPIVFTNVGDHWFWVGVKTSDIIANLRESGMRLSLKRRGIESKRNMLLPTILEPAERKLSRSQAKQQLGIDENSVMILSLARVAKYRTINDLSFADAHVPLLQQHQQAILIVVGPGDGNEDWSAAIEKTNGRIKVLKQTPATSVFFQAADIYVDSYPFVSITSLLEAGSYGLPLVSRYPYSSNACEILGADMPGLTDNLIRVGDIEEYTKVLSRLVENEELRLSLGEATKSKIEKTHWGTNWQSTLNDIYSYAMTVPKVTYNPNTVARENTVDKVCLSEPDVFLPSINSVDTDSILHWQMNLIPFDERLRLWFRLIGKGGFRNNPLNLLLSEHSRNRYYKTRSQAVDFLNRKNLFSSSKLSAKKN